MREVTYGIVAGFCVVIAIYVVSFGLKIITLLEVIAVILKSQ